MLGFSALLWLAVCLRICICICRCLCLLSWRVLCLRFTCTSRTLRSLATAGPVRSTRRRHCCVSHRLLAFPTSFCAQFDETARERFPGRGSSTSDWQVAREEPLLEPLEQRGCGERAVHVSLRTLVLPVPFRLGVFPVSRRVVSVLWDALDAPRV